MGNNPSAVHTSVKNIESAMEANTENIVEPTKDNSNAELIKFMTMNVDTMWANETDRSDPRHKWDNRRPRIVEMINNSDRDIICLQEMRKLTTSEVNTRQFLNMLDYEHEYCYYTSRDISMALGVLYNREKYYVEETIRLKHDEEDGERYVFAFGVKLRTLPSGPMFWVLSTHLSAASEDRKWESVRKMSEMEFGAPVIIAGDYNFFEDKDGGAQREKMEETFEDLAFPLENMSGTFYGYSHDRWNWPLDDMSRLDHIFARGFEKSNEAYALSELGGHLTLSDLEDRNYPSDHLAICVDLILNGD